MKAWFRIDLWKRVMIGLAIGLAIGTAVRYGMISSLGHDDGIARSQEIANIFKPLGDLFLNLIRMLVVPLIFLTLVSGVLALGDPRKLGRLGGRTIGIYMMTTLVAVTLGLIMGTIFQPGNGYDLSSVTPEQIAETQARLESGGALEQVGVYESIMRTILSIVPTNIVASMTNGDVLPIIFFAIMFGIGILLAGEAGKPMAKVFDAGSEAILKLTLIVMETAPFGVAALMAWVMADQGFSVVSSLALMTVALYLACALHMLLTHGFLIKVVGRLPLIPFYRGITDAQLVAFSTSSSSATLPVTLSVAEKNLGVGKSVASSVLPLGSTINMDGTALYQGLIALFAAQALGIDVSIGMYFTVAVMATLVSIGTAGIPSVSLFLATTTLGVVGATPEQMFVILAPLFAFDRLLDMMRTVTNITGDLAVSTLVAKWEGDLDEDIFRAEDNVTAEIDRTVTHDA
ncbi:dicarboxylate/amino acid:cation symporter [Henriciella mobilis]|uniref:dicarboxylate/amino acid:cation symporter n=1 Tax=Henriciella mobilis TaxID=2305467 RepID=UPI000E66B348|nr:dicarboxylate/amino acid:cation symporter [Henriciella mobilis]RIJ17386.1 dicarboxylate/amino acid:cation symporter [Henriciella mobilis]RIJ25625.1 dicarboxylate/amino acid:cation symporter [Henriciella mobilis]